MAQWSHPDRTLFTKLVYYGPALGGKTTNLRALHAITDPEGTHRLVSLDTADDRTLFFDLLPFELGTIFGYRVAIKVYTVPGQVRYDATRRIVLSGADAVVFVADSRRDRTRDNKASLENLRFNLRANRLDPASLPIVLQINKRDLQDAAPTEDIRRSLSQPFEAVLPAVARKGDGVLETFVAASKAMIARLVSLARSGMRSSVEPTEITAQIERAFAPHVARRASGVAPRRLEPISQPIVLRSEDLLESALRSSLELGEDLASVHARAARLEKESDALRRLNDALREVGSSFDRAAIVQAALSAAGAVMGAGSVSMVREDDRGEPSTEMIWGRPSEPLTGFPGGREFLRAALRDRTARAVDDLAVAIGGAAAPPDLEGLGALGVVPVASPRPRALVVHARPPDGTVTEADLRFLETIAAHLSVALDKARMYAELARSHGRLEQIVEDRTRALRRAYDELRTVDATKHRFLSSVSHEMRSPLTGIVNATVFLRDYRGSDAERRELLDGVLDRARTLERMLDDLLRVARLETGSELPRATDVSAADLVAEALRIAAVGGVGVWVAPEIETLSVEPERVARALANLVENASKFAGGAAVELRAVPCSVRCGSRIQPGAAFSVLDRGPGVGPDDLERIFSPFEQGGDPLTGKPRGVGLGLYEARVIARRHGGTVRYLPRQGGGSEFRIVVPARPFESAGLAEVGRA